MKVNQSVPMYGTAPSSSKDKKELLPVKGCRARVREEADSKYSGSTLVICPLVAVLQWRDEIGK